MIPEDALQLATERFGLEVHAEEGPWVPADQLRALATALKEELGYDFFVYCVALHLPAVEGNEEKEISPVPEALHVHYRVRRLGPGAPSFPFRVRLAAGESVPTLFGIYAGADWQEREQYDLLGVVFEGHPDLRRIMLPEDWEGHPLRRDYAIDTRHHPWR